MSALSPLEAQQVAGIVMLAGGFVYLAAALALLASWLTRSPSAGRRSQGAAGAVATGLSGDLAESAASGQSR